MKGFKIQCDKCNSINIKIITDKKFRMFYDDSYTDNRVYLVCVDCGNETKIHEFTTT